MAKVTVLQKIYENSETGERIPYERLAIIGTLSGEVHTLELKLEKTEMQLAKLLLASTEENQVTVRNTSRSEEDLFKSNISRSDQINLDDDD